MATYLIGSTPVHGHVVPMVTAASDLVSRGHRVVVLTGTRFAERVRAAGAEFRPLTGIADFDDRDVESYLPDRDQYRGIAQAQYDIQTIFVRTIPDQYAAVSRAIAEIRPDAILVDGAFGGAAPLLFSSAARPPVLALGVTPLTQSSRDVAPAGTALPPSSSPIGRARNRALAFVARRVLFRQTQSLSQSILRELGVTDSTAFIMDISASFDRFLQLCVPEFEYPRSDLAPNTTFVGPLVPTPAQVPLPEWWDDLDGTRPVVHVTQGTIDNRAFERLVLPTVRSLADLDVLVAVSLGGADADLGPLPHNVRVASYLPYDRLLPRTSVFVTNGGYGGIQHALSAGVPIVVAGDTEDKPEVAARVAWSGAGVNLRTGTPSAAQLRSAITQVLDDPAFAHGAQRLAGSAARHDARATIASELAEAVARGART